MAGNNNSPAPDGWPEGMARSSVNDAARENQAAIARWYRDTKGSLVTTGTSTAYVLTTNSAHGALADLSLLVFRVHLANGVAPTLAVDGLAAKPLAGVAVGDLAANKIIAAAYNSATDSYDVFAERDQREVGEIVEFGGATPPAGWLLCGGQEISRTTYAALFTAIGTTWGIGNGTTTFNVPDLRGRVTAGKDNMGGTSANRLTGLAGGLDGDILAATGGEEAHALALANLPAHRFFLFANVNAPEQVNSNLNNTSQVAESADAGFFFQGYSMQRTGTDATVGRSSSVGSNGSHNNVQPTAIVNKIIYSRV